MGGLSIFNDTNPNVRRLSVSRTAPVITFEHLFSLSGVLLRQIQQTGERPCINNSANMAAKVWRTYRVAVSLRWDFASFLTCWVSGIDDNNCSRNTMLTGGVQRPLQFVDVQRPLVVLVEIIRNLHAASHCKNENMLAVYTRPSKRLNSNSRDAPRSLYGVPQQTPLLWSMVASRLLSSAIRSNDDNDRPVSASWKSRNRFNEILFFLFCLTFAAQRSYSF